MKEKQVVGEEMKKMQEMMKSWSNSKVSKEKYRGTEASLTVEEEASEAGDTAPPIPTKEIVGTLTLLESMRKKKKQREGEGEAGGG